MDRENLANEASKRMESQQYFGKNNDDNIVPMAGGGESYEDDHEMVLQIKENIKKARDHLSKWRQDADQAYDYFAGNQWSPEDVQYLNEERRPAIVFNRIPRVINAIVGLELQNRQEVTYMPRENNDLAAADILSQAAKWVRQTCDAEDEESQAFKDCLLTGLGWTETHLDYEIDPDGAIIIERIDPVDMLYDPTATKRNLDDARWVARVRKYTRKDFHSIWPDAEVEEYDFNSPEEMQPHDATLAPYYINDQSDKIGRSNNEIEVVQYQYWKRETYYRVEDHNGEIKELTPKEFTKMKKFIEFYGWRYIRQTKRAYKQYFVAGNEVLEKGPSPVNGFTFRAMTGMQDHNENTWFGLVLLMRDPQMWANKWLSQTLHIVNTNAKGGYFAEKGAFHNPQQAESTIATSSITYLNEDGLQKIMKKEPAQFPTAIDRLLEYAVGSISELVGVNLEMLGMANREQSGILEYQRKKAGITVVADFFDALRRYRKEEGRVLAEFITNYISDGRMIRITGDALGKMVPLAREQLDFKFDIVVDEAPNSPNQREIVFDRLMQLFPALMEAGIPIPPEIIDYAPLPAPLIQAWKETLQEGPSEGEKEIERLRKRLADLEAARMEADVAEKRAKTEETKTKSVLNVSKAAHEQALAEMESKELSEKILRENVGTALDLIKEL